MPRYQVTIHFEMSESFMEAVPRHREYVNHLINTSVIEHYAVSLESRRSWITLNASSREEVEEILSRSPLFDFWTFEVDELFVLDGQTYRLPELNFN